MEKLIFLLTRKFFPTFGLTLLTTLTLGTSAIGIAKITNSFNTEKSHVLIPEIRNLDDNGEIYPSSPSTTSVKKEETNNDENKRDDDEKKYEEEK